MNEENFKSRMAFLYKIYGKTLDDDVYKIYWNTLKAYVDEHFEKMVNNIVKTFIPTSQVPFPLIPHFLQSIGMSGENRAQAAITAVKNAVEGWGAWNTVDFGDPALHAVINRFGGWPEVCSWGNAGQWKFMETKFMEAYEAAIACGEFAPPCEGNYAIGNRDKSQIGWNELQIKTFKKAIEPQKIEWIGADFSHQIENNKKEQKQIRNKNPETLAEILKP